MLFREAELTGHGEGWNVGREGGKVSRMAPRVLAGVGDGGGWWE